MLTRSIVGTQPLTQVSALHAHTWLDHAAANGHLAAREHQSVSPKFKLTALEEHNAHI